MYSVHPIVAGHLVEQRARQMQRIAGQTRLHREAINRRTSGRRGS